MFQSFVIMLREGIEAALVIGIILVVLKQTGRRDLERPVYWGMGLAILASIGAALILRSMPTGEETYEGILYWVSAAFVISMLWWMQRRSRTLRRDIENRVQQTIEAEPKRNRKEVLGLGAFAFLMVFREGAEAVMFLAAVNLTTDALLSFIGSSLGLIGAILFCVMFVRGSLHVNLRRFFVVTEWVLIIFVLQLAINGYHEFAEAGLLPATQRSMALVGPIVRNNSLFILAIVAIPLFIWLTRTAKVLQEEGLTPVERRLAIARLRRERFYRYGAILSTLLILVCVGVVYAQEVMPKQVPAPEPVARQGDFVILTAKKMDDGKLHRLGYLTQGKLVRLLAMKTSDGKIRTAVDSCEICGSFGYLQEGAQLICLNCGAEINPLTLGVPGGCNPIPLESTVTPTEVKIPVSALEKVARLFADQPGLEEIDPVCGMKVKMNEAAAFATYNGKTYYFCNAHDGKCQAMFQQNPAQYIK